MSIGGIGLRDLPVFTLVIIGLGLVSGQAVAQEPAEGTLSVTGAARDLDRLSLWRQAPGREAQPVTVRPLPGDHPDAVTLHFECVPGDYFIRSATLVSRPFRIDAGGCGNTRDVALFPAATLRGRVVVPPDVQSRPVVAVAIRACADSMRGDDLGQYRFRAAADGLFSIPVPAGCLSTSLRAPAFAPLPYSRLDLKRDEVRDLGVISLKHGATLTAAVRSNDAPEIAAAVSLVPAEEYEAFLEGLFRGKPMPHVVAGTTNRAGEVSFIGVSPGIVYLVAASRDRAGFAGPLELVEGEDVEADPVAVWNPASVAFVVTGDSRWIPPELEVYIVGTPAMRELPRANATVVSVKWPEAEPEPHRVPAPGRWLFRMLAGSTEVDTEEIDVLPGVTTTVELSVARGLYRGRVLIGDVPVAGTLFLSRQRAPLPRAAEATTDDAGRFAVALAEPGLYYALFLAKDGYARWARGSAEFTQAREALIQLPATRISGSVGFADGRPAPGATVTVEPPTERVIDEPSFVPFTPAATADASGAFTIRCLEPGVYQTSARLGSRRSQPQPVVVTEGASAPVRLVLPDDGGLTLRLVDSRGTAVPSVSGVIFAAPGQVGTMPQSVVFRVGPDGTSNVPVTGTPGVAVQVALVSPGFPATAMSAIPDDDGTVTCAVPSGAGQLRVTFPRLTQSAGERDDLDLTVLLSDRGGVLPLNLLTALKTATQVTGPTSVTVVLGAVAAGEWQLAKFADARGWVLSFSGGPPPTVLRTFTVAPGSTVAVDVRQ
jgi:Carboxypeptidase regulatory-like domain